MADIQSNKPIHDRAFDKAVEKALRLVGGLAERRAKETISDMEAVDTGFLRNSITYALDGEAPHISEYQDDKGLQTGEYEGDVPSSGKERSVYIGTNVYYAPYVEFGTYKMEARPFMASSIQGGKSEFEQLFEEAFRHFF